MDLRRSSRVSPSAKAASKRDWPVQRFESFEEAERANVTEELRRTPAERLAAVESLRRRWHGEDYELAHRLVGPLAVPLETSGALPDDRRPRSLSALGASLHGGPRPLRRGDAGQRTKTPKRAGLGAVAPKPEELATPGPFWMFGRKPVRIDLLTEIPAVAFRGAWKRRLELEIDGIVLPVIGRKDLIANKRSAGRAKDLADVESLLRIANAEGEAD